MNSPKGMHPRIFERRKAVFMDQLEYVSPEDEEQAVADWVSHHEGKLPRPENYRKKTTERLRITLRTIDDHLKLFEKRREDDWLLCDLSAMYQRHRGHVVKELARRMVKRT